MSAEVWTSCYNCCFENNYGCTLNKLELFEKNGAKIVKDEDAITIEGRICNTKRNEGWWAQYSDNYEEQLYKETELKYAALFAAKNYNCLKQYIKYLKKEKIQPVAYYIVYKGEDFNHEVKNISRLMDTLNKSWTIKTPLEDYSVEHYIEEFIKTGAIDEPFILYIKNCYYDYESNLIEYLNRLINKELKQIMLFESDGHIFIPTHLAKTLGLFDAQVEIVHNGHEDKIITEYEYTTA